MNMEPICKSDQTKLYVSVMSLIMPCQSRLLAEKEKFKRRINEIESLMGRERPANKVDIRPEETIGFSVLTILTVVLLGFK